MKKIGMIIIISIAIVTFWFSSKANTESHVQSDGLLIKMKILDQEDVDNKTQKYMFWDLMIRKTAHFSLYLILGVGSYLFTGSIKKAGYIVFIFAGIDEFHQHFSPGRTGQFIDVILDTAGGVSGASLMKFIFKTLNIEKKSKINFKM